MQATLIINPNSGGAEQVKPEELIEALRETGYEPVLKSTSSEEELDTALKGIQGLVVTAGGDGVRYVSVHRGRPPLQIGRAAETAGVRGERLRASPGGQQEPDSGPTDGPVRLGPSSREQSE